MRLTRLQLLDWRNLASVDLETDARFVVLHGDNAQGKTNILEAVWLLANLRSFRETSPSRLIRQGAEEAKIQATVQGVSGRRKLAWSRTPSRRVMKLDGSNPAELVDWFRVLRAILFCPADADVVRGDPAGRRRYMDRAAFNANPGHLLVVREFRRALGQKAALLRGGDASDSVLDAFDDRLAQLGARLALRRRAAFADLVAPFRDMHGAVTGRSEEPRLRLTGVGGRPEGDEESLADWLRGEMSRVRSEEIRRGRALVGPQRDDLSLSIDGRSARHFASQGQARTLVLALKLAELSVARARGESPLFLLDDLTSELDQRRMQRLIELLGQLNNQVWVTTTDPQWLGPLPGAQARLWSVIRGGVEKTSSGTPE